MSQRNKRTRLSDAILNIEGETLQTDPGNPSPQGIVATALDMHREGLKERLGALEEATAKARARGDILEEIQPELIDDPLPADRHRRFRSDQALDELTRSIEINGQHVPILVRAHPSELGRYEIAAGRRRLEACTRLQRPVLARILQLDDAAMLDLQYRENAERSDVSVFERGRWFLEVQERIRASTTALAKRFELSQPMMVEYLKLARLPDNLIDILDDPRELTIAQSKKLHAALASRRDAEGLMIRAIERNGQGQSTARQVTWALSALTAPTVKAAARIIKDRRGRAVVTVTQSGRQTLFRWAPEMEETIINKVAAALPDLIDQLRDG